MPRVYSTYEAKTHFSEILRRVRSGEKVLVSYHGRPVAEIGPIREEDEPLEQRLDRLTEEGVLRPGKPVAEDAFRPIAHRPGALERFLASRD